jgi:hypothetical protein
MTENRVENSVNNKTRGLIPFSKGESGNPNGRPKGSLNYSTKMKRAIEALAMSRDITPEAVEELIYKTGLTKALNGDWKFYEDFMNREHGKPIQPTDITSNGETIEGVVVLPIREVKED